MPEMESITEKGEGKKERGWREREREKEKGIGMTFSFFPLRSVFVWRNSTLPT